MCWTSSGLAQWENAHLPRWRRALRHKIFSSLRCLHRIHAGNADFILCAETDAGGTAFPVRISSVLRCIVSSPSGSIRWNRPLHFFSTASGIDPWIFAPPRSCMRQNKLISISVPPQSGQALRSICPKRLAVVLFDFPAAGAPPCFSSDNPGTLLLNRGSSRPSDGIWRSRNG